MGKYLHIVYDEGLYLENQGSFLGFNNEDAEVVEQALFDAEARGALSAHFKLKDREFWLRTDKYLYWVTGETKETP